MAKPITTSGYKNGKGVERIGLQLDRDLAVKLAGYEGEDAMRLAQTQVVEALIVELKQEEREAEEAKRPESEATNA